MFHKNTYLSRTLLEGMPDSQYVEEFNMQEYRDKKVIDALFGKHADLEKQGKADIDSRKADRVVIGEMPKKGRSKVVGTALATRRSSVQILLSAFYRSYIPR